MTCANPAEIVAYLPQVRPNFFFAVPRIWEKLKAGLKKYSKRLRKHTLHKIKRK